MPAVLEQSKKNVKPLKAERFKYKFKVKDLEKMYEAGIFKPDEKVELLNGEVVKLSPIGLKHAIVVDNLVEILGDLIREDKNLKETYSLRIQNPIFLSQENLPEPDVAVVDKSFRKEKQHPKAKHVELLIEVSDTTLEKDRQLKLPIYAKYKIKQVWIVDLKENQIEIYTNPTKK
ncbi:Uma2 family endonuclease, partial [Hydrogenivirga sp. 128-5-R1-1]|uniref:Uma2 family endonuclease n=1 Tax=Hydrogenivirga sp. 128-5-R1-1 TaxID=392423 RepID=UPI00015F019C